MGLDHSDKIQAYCELLAKWNEKINLIGRASINEIMERHVLDCLQISNYIANKDVDLADLGTGAGLPGIILAISGFTKVTLIDSDQKKCVFLREARRVLGLDLEILNVRVEELSNRKFDVIVSRALASLTDLLELSYPLMAPSSKCIFLKGINHEKELLEAKNKWMFDSFLHESKTGCGGVVLEVQNIRRL